jgi:hypothetical protein
MPMAPADGLKGAKWLSLMDKRLNALFAREGLFEMSAAKEEEDGKMRERNRRSARANLS